MCDHKGYFREIDISTRKLLNTFPVKSAQFCVVTFDNKFLVTAEHGMECRLTKWSVRTKKELYTWNGCFD